MNAQDNAAKPKNGYELFLDGRYQDSLAALESERQAHPERMDIYVISGWCYRELKDYASMERVSKEGIRIQPTDHRALRNLATALYWQAKYSEAVESFDSYLKYKNEPSVDEILLYFSGHGNFVGNEFYYVWGDYEESKKRQTCLQNSTIDSYLKTINAKLTIKIVDACQSGIPYLKGGDEFDKFLNTSKNSFNKCYFLFSSQNDEPSKASTQVSFFTKSIIDSLSLFDVGKNVRYKDVMNYVSDEFERSRRENADFQHRVGKELGRSYSGSSI